MNMNGVGNGATSSSAYQGSRYNYSQEKHCFGDQPNHVSKYHKDEHRKVKDSSEHDKVGSSAINGCVPWSLNSESNHQHYNSYGSLPSANSNKGDRHHRVEKRQGRSGPNVSNGKQPPRSAKTPSLHRSNSSLNLDRAEEVFGSVIHREYGSASSIDIISNNKDSFFSMLHDFCNQNQDQRSPGPAKIQDYLRGKLDHTPSSENASNTLANGVASLDDISSPKLKSKIQKFLEMKEKGKLKPKMLSNEPSIFKKLSRGSTTKHDSDTHAKENVDGAALSSEIRPADKLHKKAFIHHDCQSITSHLDGKNIQSILSRRRNTTTGASAASSLHRSTEDISSENSDYGDDRSNDLVLACPFFRNELGGEGERTVCLTMNTAHQKNIGAEQCSTLHKPCMSRGISVLENSNWGSRTCPFQRPSIMIENIDSGANYYRIFFKGQDHQNWFGVDDNLGPVAISIKREKISEEILTNSSRSKPALSSYLYRIIIRTSELAVLRGSVLEDSIPSVTRQPSSRGIQPREILDFIAPELKQDCLKLGINDPSTEEQLVKLDQQSLTNRHKVGIMYCKAGQSTEEEMYNNENAGLAFNEFLEMLGQRVRLKGFDKYRAGLDVKSDSTGTYSVYSTYQSCEVMFHVSTMLPYSANNKQQLSRKSCIGNDIVTIVFQDPGSLPFTPKSIRSHFQHVFIVIRAINPCSEHTRYKVSVSRSKDVPVFGPAIPADATFPKSKAFAEFLLAKVINAENAAYRSTKFVTMATKTRQGYLKDLALHHVSSTTIDSAPKFSVLSFGGSKKRERSNPRIVLDSSVRGAIAWQVFIEDYGLGITLHCYIGISCDSIVVMEERTNDKVFVSPCLSVLGWTTQSDSLKIYHHQGECLVIRSNNLEDLKEIVTRLGIVTQGCETEEITLKRNNLGQLGFHVQHEGIVTEVEYHGLAWQTGLRQGSRLVEICKVAVLTISHDQMVDLLKTSVVVTVTIIPPLKEGVPRRGCNFRNCKYLVMGEIGDYENICLSDSDESPMKNKENPSQQTPHSRFRGHSHGRVAGRKLENQLKNMKAQARIPDNSLSHQNRNDDHHRSNHASSSQDSPPPPPLPVRLLDSTVVSSSTPIKFSEVRPSLNSTNFNKPAPFPVPGVPIQRPSSPPSYHHHQIRHAHSMPPNSISNPPQHKVHVHSTSHATEHTNHHWSDSHYLSELETTNHRKVLSNGLNAGANSSGDELSNSRGSSPQVGKLTDSSLPKPWNINRNSHRQSQDVGVALSELKSAKLKSSVMQSNTSTLSSQSSGSSSTFHEDLLRLIDPDLIDSQTDVHPTEQTPLRENKHKQSVEELLQEMETGSSAVNSSDHSGVICTTALPAQVISSASPSPSDYKMSKEDRLSPRVKSSPVLKGNQNNSGKEPIIPIPIPDNEQIDWRSLVDTATKAMQVVKKNPSDANSDCSSSKDVGQVSESENSSDEIQVMRLKLRQMEKDLTKEQRKNETLEFEVRQLKEENIKLQEESQAAADQLRRFTEWFFQAIDKQ